MDKKKLNLRKVAMIFAYLAVTVMFVACDKPNGNNGNDDDGGGNGGGGTTSGKIDPKLVGEWGAGGATGVSNYNPITREYTPFGTTSGFAYSFSKDGKFISATYQQRLNGSLKETMAIFGSANYEVVDNNTIKLTKRTGEIINNGKSNGQNSLGNTQFQYMIGTDEYGEYLIDNLGSDQPLSPNGALKFRKLI